jgi:hypothetical protein
MINTVRKTVGNYYHDFSKHNCLKPAKGPGHSFQIYGPGSDVGERAD